MGTALVLLVLLVIAVFAVYSYRRRLSVGCCGAGGDAPEKRRKVADRNPKHYPYETTLAINGMHCTNCQIRVENALNTLDGVWASVDLHSAQASVRMRRKMDAAALCDAVQRAGYGAQEKI
ncbi:MAG: heavy-metal-associated domain-containing protein [Intestinibacillus sp.]